MIVTCNLWELIYTSGMQDIKWRASLSKVHVRAGHLCKEQLHSHDCHQNVTGHAMSIAIHRIYPIIVDTQDSRPLISDSVRIPIIIQQISVAVQRPASMFVGDPGRSVRWTC